MKKLALLGTILLVLAVGALPATAITWGQPDGEGHPNVGAIVVEYSPEPSVTWVWAWCSGTLIAPNAFLTAGHCTYFLNYYLGAGYLEPDDVYVSFDPDNALEEGWLPVEAIITHPDYVHNPGGMGIGQPDVGLLILQEPASGITPATLPEAGFLDGLRADGELRDGGRAAQFTVVGYGDLLEWPPPQFVDAEGIRYVAESEFLNLRDSWLHMSQNHAPGQGNEGTCYGDSGGPTFWTTAEDDAEILVAVTSWGDMQCVATGTAYRIDIPVSLDFIYDELAKLD
jgi:secreted trypsin-like serine protease